MKTTKGNFLNKSKTHSSMETALQTLLPGSMADPATQNSDTFAQLPYDPLDKHPTRTRTLQSMKWVVMIILLIPFLQVNAQTQTVILTSGSSWTVPSNVYSITVECWGGGGGGSNTTTAGRTGGGGGGGAYAKKNSIIVTPGSTFTYSIGGGGGGSSAGGDTWFGSTSTVLAKGGSAGVNNSSTGGAGGSATSSVGDVKYDGGKGGNGTGTGCCDGAGGGGGGAGSTGNGNSGPNGSVNGSFLCTSGYDVIGGLFKLDYGGDGGVGVGYDGNGGGAYGYSAGGGGAKSGCVSGSNRTGGSGKQGLIRITYCYSPSSTNAGSDVTICNSGSTTLNGSATGYSGTSQLLFQDFENTGWTITYAGTASARFYWTYGPVSTANGNGNSGSPTFIFANGDNSTTSSSTTITSPTFSTVGYSSLTLTFRHHYDDYDATDYAYVEVYNGSSWVTVQTYTTDQGTLTSFATASINLNSYVGISNFAIRFRYTNYDDWYWLIDDISINGNIAPAVTYSWSPSTGLSATNIANPTASPASTQTYTLTTSHNGCSVTTDDVVVTVRPDVSNASATATIALCANPTNPYADLSATAPGSGIAGVWSISSGSGSIVSASSSTTTTTGLSTNATATQVQWTLYYTSTPACSTALASPISITPTSLANINQVSLQNNGAATTTPKPSYATCKTCSIKNGNTYTYYGTDGKIIATILDKTSNAADLGSTEVCVGYDYNAGISSVGVGDVKTITDNFGRTQPYLPRSWTIKPTAGSDATVTLYFTAAELAALTTRASTTPYIFSGLSGLAVTKYPGGSGAGSFIAPGSTGGVFTPSTFSSYNSDYQVTFDVNSFSTFYVHPQTYPFAVLPVELVSFTGYNDKDQNVLNWTTASERNTDRFEIEKSTDGIEQWSYLGWQKAVGGTIQQVYTFSDNQPIVGHNYYRLKIVDNDGTYTYSNTIDIPVAEAMVNGFVKVYPNPTDGLLNVYIQSTKNTVTLLQVTNLLGQVITSSEISLQKGVDAFTVNLTNAANGAYIVSFTDGFGTKHLEKIMKQ